MNLEQIKDDYVRDNFLASHELDNWYDFQYYFASKHPEWFENHWENIVQIAQKECLKRASENAEASTSYSNPYVISESITNENNIIK